jgi:tetratricopeptide (TPR) repeat protein
VKYSAALFCAGGLVIGLVIGFSIANAISRNEINQIRTVTELKPATPPEKSPVLNDKTNADVLSEEEIRQAVARADSNKNDIDLQRKIGLALYQYAKMQRQIDFLPAIRGILQRVKIRSSEDFEISAALGEISFLIGQEPGKSEYLSESRKYYETALKLKPENLELRTDLGSTYLFANPPEPRKAIAEYLQVIRKKPLDERALQFLATALLMTENTAEAEKRIGELRQVNPENSALPDLSVQLAQKKLKN